MTYSPLGMNHVRSLVLDPGMNTTRVGFSGDDLPTFIFPSSINTSSKRSKFGYESLNEPGAEIMPVWELSAFQGKLYRIFTNPQYLEALLEHCLTILEIDFQEVSTLAPLLIVDPMPAFSVETKQLISQLVFEKFRLPGLYFASNAVLSAFASGKHSALIVDIGASGTCVVGISDGLMTAHSWQRLGGNTMTNACAQLLQQFGMTELVVHSQVAPGSKEAVEMGKAPKWRSSNRQLCQSYLKYQQNLLLEDFKISVIQVSEVGAKENELSLKPPKFYEFPNGFNRNFGAERFHIGELMFNPPESDLLNIIDQIEKVHQSVDSHAACNIVISGGGSLVEGLTERITMELQNRLPRGYGRGALRISHASSLSEQRHSSWIGGSLLTSIGSFHRVWVAPQEFADIGLAAFDRRPYASSIV